MATTTNYGWTTPDNTDLVKDGASAIRTLGSSIDTTLKAQIDAQIPDSLLTTTGDTIYATGASTPARLGIGSTGQVLTVAGGVPTWSTPASGTITFTIRLTPSASWSPKTIATNGSTIYVAGGSNGVLYSSTDSGVTWTSRTSGFGSSVIGAIAYGNGIFVAVGNSGLITTSTDGVTWTARTAGVAANNLYYVAYINNLFVAVGGGANGGTGGITTSTDGITWTKRTTPTTSSTNIYSVTYGGGYYVAVGNANTRAGYYSTDAVTWTVLPASMATTLEGVFYNGSRFFALAQSGDGFYNAGAPSSAWSAIGGTPNPYVVDNSMNTTTPVYSGYMYFPVAAFRNNIYKVSTAMTSSIFNEAQPRIDFPDTSNAPINAIFIDSNGKLTCGDSNGRIYTAQL
jgi:hypothetical protein